MSSTSNNNGSTGETTSTGNNLQLMNWMSAVMAERQLINHQSSVDGVHYVWNGGAGEVCAAVYGLCPSHNSLGLLLLLQPFFYLIVSHILLSSSFNLSPFTCCLALGNRNSFEHPSFYVHLMSRLCEV